MAVRSHLKHVGTRDTHPDLGSPKPMSFVLHDVAVNVKCTVRPYIRLNNKMCSDV